LAAEAMEPAPSAAPHLRKASAGMRMKTCGFESEFVVPKTSYDKALRILQSGAKAPTEEIIRKWFAGAISAVRHTRMVNEDQERCLASLAKLKCAALEASRALVELRASILEDRQTSPLPVADEEEFYSDLIAISSMRYKRPRGAKNHPEIHEIHLYSALMLESCGLQPQIAPSESSRKAGRQGNTAILGGFLCQMAGIPLKKGTSSINARRASSKEGIYIHSVRSRRHLLKQFEDDPLLNLSIK